MDVGLGVYGLAVDKLYDKLPNKAFSGDTYKKPFKKNSRSGRRNSRQDSRDDSRDQDNGNYQNGGSRNNKYRGAAAGAAGAYGAEELYDDYRQPAPRRRSDDDDRVDNYNHQGYQPDPNTKSQGDPNFGSGRRRERARTLDGARNGDDDRDDVNRGTMARQQQQDENYPPPARGNDFHRYNPRDYQPAGYDNERDLDRYDQGPPDRPRSADSREYARRDRRDDRREHRSRRKSPSPDGLRGVLKKNFEMSDTGLTSGALGALAGGLIGNEVGKGVVATLVGAAIGGLGANAWEARDHNKQEQRKREEERREKSRKSRGPRDCRRSSVYDDRDRYNNDPYQSQGYGGDRGYQSSRDDGRYRRDDSGSEDSDARAQRKAERRRNKERNAQTDDGMNWGDVLKE